MRKLLIGASLMVLGIGAAACGGADDSPITPGGPNAPPAGAIVINIARTDGARSFEPNPATVPAGQTVVWRNVDAVTHRVILDGGGLDTGNIAPGAFSTAMTLPAVGPYHCSLHPEMVGVTAR